MALISGSSSAPSKEGSPRRLAEHLQEQQEPFVLEVHLLERGCRRKSFYSEGGSGCRLFSSNCSCRSKSSRGVTRSFSLGSGRRKKKSPGLAKKCSEMVKTLCNKLVSVSEIVRLKACDVGDGKFDNAAQGRRNQKEAVTMEETERLSSASISTEFNSCSESDVEVTTMDGIQTQRHPSHQPDAERSRTIEWRRAEENKQSSPDSVLDEIGASPVYNVGTSREEESRFSLVKKPTEESIFSASLWGLLIRSRRENEGVSGPSSNTSSQHISSKKALQQSKQLLFDCVREAVESQGRKQRKTGHLMAPEELGRIICHNMRVWSRQSVNKKKITRLLRSDLLGSFEEWDSFQGFTGQVAKEVGDQILEEIKDEIVEEVIDLCIFKTK